MIGFSAMAVVITSASQTILTGSDPKTLWDPVVLLSQIAGSAAPPGLDAPLLAGELAFWWPCSSLFGVAVATISTNIAANVISPANDFANCAPRLISFGLGGPASSDSHHAVEAARRCRRLHLQLAGGLTPCSVRSRGSRWSTTG